MGKKIDITGRRSGKLTAIRMVSEYRYPNGERGEKWLCHCDCGNDVIIFRKSFIAGNSKSCGCIRGESRRTHGGKGTRIYNIWCNIKDRCFNANNSSYSYYGGRGISMCNEWRNDFSSFREWAYNNGYEDNLTVDRIDVNQDYCPENCRWVDRTAQANNRTNTIRFSYNGEEHTCAEWARITGISYDLINDRYHKGLPPDKILYDGKFKTGPKKSA